MKKIIVFLMCMMIGTTLLAGCSNNSEPFEEKNYTADSQIQGIMLDVRDREIEVSLSEDQQVHVKYFENSKEGYDISVSDENVLIITTANQKEWTDYVGKAPSDEIQKIFLQIPDKLLTNLTLSTTNEDILLPTLTVTENITISANGGNISFENLNAGQALTLTAKNGDISGMVGGSYEDYAIQSNIKKGESNLPDQKDDGEKRLNVSCNNGNINIEFAGK